MFAASNSENIFAAGVGTPARCITSLAKALEDSSWAACLVGPKILSPCSVNTSTMPSASGASGPTIVRSISCSTAQTAKAPRFLGEISMFVAMLEVPAFPGAQYSSLSCELFFTFQAIACSRPPPPTTKTFIPNSLRTNLSFVRMYYSTKEILMSKMSFAGENHCHAARLRRCNHVFVFY